MAMVVDSPFVGVDFKRPGQRDQEFYCTSWSVSEDYRFPCGMRGLCLHAATATLCFSRSSTTRGATLARISSKSPFTRFASAMQRATSLRFNCPSAKRSHFRKSFRQSSASSPSA